MQTVVGWAAPTSRAFRLTGQGRASLLAKASDCENGRGGLNASAAESDSTRRKGFAQSSLTKRARCSGLFDRRALFVGSALFWRRNKRATVASLICGAAEVAVAALTDYPGGVKHAISFPLQRK